MKRKFFNSLLFIQCFPFLLSAQKSGTITFAIEPYFINDRLQLEETSYLLSNGDSLHIDVLKFYISAIELWKGTEIVWKETNSFHLVDVSDEKSMKMNLQAPADLYYDRIQFTLGIDSLTNVSGVKGGDLDPTRGMYWAWQSGYINFKMEGRSAKCPARNHEYAFHLGGYLQPYFSAQSVNLNLGYPSPFINVFLDVQNIVESIDFTVLNHVMSPSESAVKLSQKVAASFYIRQP